MFGLIEFEVLAAVFLIVVIIILIFWKGIE